MLEETKGVWVYVVVQGRRGEGREERREAMKWVERVREVVWAREKKWKGRERDGESESEGEESEEEDGEEGEGERRLKGLVKVVGRAG